MKRPRQMHTFTHPHPQPHHTLTVAGMAERVRSLLFALQATLGRLGDPKRQQQQGGGAGAGGGAGEHALKGDILTLVQQLMKRAARALQDRGALDFGGNGLG